MKKYSLLILFLLPAFLFGGKYGIGVILGSPSGFSGKAFLARRSAVQINAGWSFIDNVGFHITGDYQFLFPGVIRGESGEALNNVVPYLGVGGSFRVKENEQNDETRFHLGMRIGGGIEYLIDRFGVFLELYPVANFVPETDFGFEGGLGFRFYF
jgi:hypothetical protein